MKQTLVVLVFILAGLVDIAGQIRSSFDPNGGEFQVSDTKPKGFEDFQRMYLQTHNADGRPIHPKGGIEIGTLEYAMRKIVLNGRNWSFETGSIDGVRYIFRGRLSRIRHDEHGAVIGDRILQGRLIKLLGGKISAAAYLVFSFVYYSD